MNIQVLVDGRTLNLLVGGHGLNNVKWLALRCALEVQKRFYPHIFCPPISVSTMDSVELSPRSLVKDWIGSDRRLKVILAAGQKDDGSWGILSDPVKPWVKACFGKKSHLQEVEIEWNTSRNEGVPIPCSVVGVIEIHPECMALYRTEETRIGFDLPLEPVDRGNRTFSWIAKLTTPPGNVSFRFADSFSASILSRGLSSEDGYHRLVVERDLPPVPQMEPNYSDQFLSDWELVQLPSNLVGKPSIVRSLFFNHYEKLSVLFHVMAGSRRPRRITYPDIQYLLECGQFACEDLISLPEMMSIICFLSGDLDTLSTILGRITSLETDQLASHVS